MKLRASDRNLRGILFPGHQPGYGQQSICDGVPGNLVTNCGFETGNFSGWTQGGNLGYTGVARR